MFKKTAIILILLLGSLCSCKHIDNRQVPDVQIAFLSDVHLGDIYGTFQDSDYKGVLNPGTGKYTLARTMQSQLESTRLFNENYFAFLTALDDVVKRNVKIVVLPGDFSDDGQPVNIRGIKNILNEYSSKYGIDFIITTGNHDVAKPFLTDSGKTDFLGTGGKSQVIMSKAGMYVPKKQNELPVIITKDIGKMGYAEVLKELGDFGFYPKKEDFYWETPFTSYNVDDYNYKIALEQSTLGKRTYKMPPYNLGIPDLSYLVEPKKGLWILAIDGNVYLPKKEASNDPKNPLNYNSPNIGYNNVLTHKKYLITWVTKVAKEAKKRGKTLIAFSHYPMIDFNDNATNEMKELFGKNNMQLHRVPSDEVAQAFADAGIKVHFGGHMHINDTGVKHFKNGSSLINIQIPSLAAYIPAYKLLTIKRDDIFEIETIIIDSVPDFKTLFPLYRQEHDYLKKNKNNSIWDIGVLNSKTYKTFTEWHLKELVRLRFLKNDWPQNLKELLINDTGKDLLLLALDDVELLAFEKELKNNNKSIEMFKAWTGLDMINDFYKMRSADKLAISDIGQDRLDAYKIVCQQIEKSNDNDLKLWAKIFLKMCKGEPANHFQIDLKSNTIKRINPLY